MPIGFQKPHGHDETGLWESAYIAQERAAFRRKNFSKFLEFSSITKIPLSGKMILALSVIYLPAFHFILDLIQPSSHPHPNLTALLPLAFAPELGQTSSSLWP